MSKNNLFDQTNIYPELESVSAAAAARWVSLCKEAISDHGSFHVALSGGSTPKRLYQLLAAHPFSEQIDWAKVHIYFGDERFVPHDHPDSNYRMAREAMLDQLAIPESQIHPVDTSLSSAAEAAETYAQELQQQLPLNHNGQHCFDLMLLGMGPDGHTASLFPETEILHEQQTLCAASYVEKMTSWRISLTFKTINTSHHIALLVCGENKVEALRHAMRRNTPRLPIQRLVPQGSLEWLLDEAAAKGLAEVLA
ncbi:6-phosphogluconolactonase [Solemya pervernicosa gill symbiont]|uniref:6-phosphogluconolactonase n=2 Tax=Gammaproteobacteria incertae sedis TaxID=118884 RepID=A0A1T2L115_9GAMM|nr:6-phosphogluconolactonase [Candidatus Reidiella endopervernicosa]OOZ38795.1 6-phosphogluconolactonase [Solemya pervernicosa gill symbiont]QKQ25925.1 6-phosphogluconolactonase [Candidatus Reidiella endopervernicosa]